MREGDQDKRYCHGHGHFQKRQEVSRSVLCFQLVNRCVCIGPELYGNVQKCPKKLTPKIELVGPVVLVVSVNGQSSCKLTHTALPIEIYTDLTLSVMMRIPLLGQFGEEWIKKMEINLEILKMM